MYYLFVTWFKGVNHFAFSERSRQRAPIGSREQMIDFNSSFGNTGQKEFESKLMQY